MNFQISMVSQVPIYEQIELQIREQILAGELPPGTQMPSIRAMAKELRIGIITVKRAYEDLCAEGMLVSHPGKGVYVAEVDADQAKAIHREELVRQLQDVCQFARSSSISLEELLELTAEVYRAEEYLL